MSRIALHLAKKTLDALKEHHCILNCWKRNNLEVLWYKTISQIQLTKKIHKFALSLSLSLRVILRMQHLLSNTSLARNSDICCIPHHSWCACSLLVSKHSHRRGQACNKGHPIYLLEILEWAYILGVTAPPSNSYHQDHQDYYMFSSESS